jgi:hypothetical protein
MDVFAGVDGAGMRTWPVLGLTADMHNTVYCRVLLLLLL